MDTVDNDVRLIQCIEKTPGENLPYGFDWTDWLAGDTIASSSWSIPAGLTVGVASYTTVATAQKLSGGTVGVMYDCVNTITTATGNIGERTLQIQMVTNKGTGEI